MTFSEDLEEDIRDVFLNPAEFGGAITLNGKPYMAVIEENAGNAKNGAIDNSKDKERLEGVFRRFILVQLATSDINDDDQIIKGRRITLSRGDGIVERWTVTDANDQDGMTYLYLKAVDS